MKPLEITIRGENGYLFCGAHPRTYTFVPEDCVTFRKDGSIAIDQLVYFQRRWAARNMRFNRVETSGSQLFPNARRPVIEWDAPGLQDFLEHMRSGYASALSVH